MNKLKILFLYISQLPLYYLGNIIPKDDSIWIFGSWFGIKYADNSKSLFEHISKKHKNIRPIWITNNQKIMEELQQKNYEVYKKYSIRAIFIGLRAKYSVFVHSNNADNMIFLNNKRVKKIQLWHGIPLKKIGYDDSFSKHKISRWKILLFPFLDDKIDLMISVSNEDKLHFQSAFNVSKEFIFSTGYPRNDALFTSNKKHTFKVTYLPTFRDDIGSQIDLFSEYDFKLDEWNSKLPKMGILFDIKMHPVNKPKDEVLKRFSDTDNILFLNEVDVSEILPETDILITDYSSVYFDFLLTDKPIIFAPFDYDKYITKDRELYYDYNEVTPGPKCQNWGEVLQWIEKFKNDSTLYSDERKKIKDRFHEYQDGNSCERVYNELINMDK